MNPAIENLYREHNTPNEWYSLCRWLDRVFARALDRREERIPFGEQHREIIASIDLSRVGYREQYLMKHLLILQGTYERALNGYQNLRPLHRGVDEIDDPIVLSESPTHPWRYLQDRNIHL